MFSATETFLYSLLSAFLTVIILANLGSIEVSLPNSAVASATSELPSGIEVLCIEGYKFIRDRAGNGSLVQVIHNGGYAVECK